MINSPQLNLESRATQAIQPETTPAELAGMSADQVQQVSKEIKEVTSLYNIGVAAGSSLDLNEVIRTLFRESSRLIDTSNFALVLCNESCDSLIFKVVLDQRQPSRPFSIKRYKRGLINRVLVDQAPLLISDLKEADGKPETAHIHQSPVRSWLGVPMVNPTREKDTPMGAIVTWSYEPNAFDKHTVWLLSAIGTQASIAIRNARLFEASQLRAREMTLLNEVARTLSATLHLDEVLTLIMEQVDHLLNVEAGSLLLTDAETGNLVFQIALGDTADKIKPFQVPKGQGIAGEVAESGQPLMVADTAKDQRHFKKFDQQTNFQTRNILCVPLILHDHVIGVLEVMNKRIGTFTQHDLDVLSSVASYAAIAIDNARLHESVLAERDKVIEVQEETRKELARDLHDGPTQLVAGLMMSLDFCKKALEKDPSLLSQEFDRMSELAERASHQLRTALFQLRPLVLETQGFGAALETFTERRQKDIGPTPKLTVKIEADTPNGELSRQDGKVEATIFAIVQETVNNAVKHAQANEIIVEVKETQQAIYTTIKDDGRGFDVDKILNNYEERGSLGMLNLQERTELIGGELTIKSVPDQGTKITIYVPKEKAERLRRRGTTGGLTIPSNMLNKP